MAGHETAEHGIYIMEWQEEPRGVLISSQYEGSGQKPKRTNRSELQKKAHKIGVALTFHPDKTDSSDSDAKPLLHLAARELSPSDLMETAQQLTGKFFPGIMTVIPCEA